MHRSALPPAENLKLVALADIARGGMGMVQLSKVVGGRLDGRLLAVKRLNPEIEQDPEFTNMFLDETWMTASIASPHVVRVEAWGKDDLGMYLAVELVQGVSLSRLMKESRAKKEPFAERTVAFIISQICAGLDAAHALKSADGSPLGLVHRDLTPGNILVGFDGLVKIADFGIAKAEERLTSTRIGTMKGKPAYMAPEQARGGGLDGRADLFSIGVVTYELLAGKRPWNGNNDLEVLVQVTTTEPPDILELRNVSQVFAEVIRRCLRKVPGERFSSASEIRTLLDTWRVERGFDGDDRESLASFVQRNTPQQLAWFNQALAGALRLGGVTFMDLEARIDSGRKVSAAGQAPAPALSGSTVPIPAAGAQPSSTTRHLEEVDENARTRFMEARPPLVFPQTPQVSTVAMASVPPLRPAEPSPPSSTNLGGTLAMSPEDAGALTGSSSGPDSGGMPATMALSPEDAAAMLAGARKGGASTVALTPEEAAMLSMPLGAAPRPMVDPLAVGYANSGSGSFPGPPMAAEGGYTSGSYGRLTPTDLGPPESIDIPKKSRAPLVLFVLLLVLGGAAALFFLYVRPRYGLWLPE